MNFYFCEKCGKRISDDEVKNKGLKGWFCSDCGAGVMTMAMSAVSEKQARELLAQAKAQEPPAAPPPDEEAQPLPVRSKPRSSRSNLPVRPSGTALSPSKGPAAPARAARRENAPAATPAPGNGNQNWMVTGGVAGAAIVIALAIVFSLKKTGPHGAEPAAAAPLRGAPAPASPPPRTPLEKKSDSQPEPARDPNAKAEAAAEKAFDDLKRKLDALGDGEKEKKIEAAEEYLEKYNEFIIAARVRTILDALNNPAPDREGPERAERTERTERTERGDAATRQAQDSTRSALTQKLKEANPNFSGITEMTFHGAQINVVRLEGESIADISALKGMSIRNLALHATRVKDLRPLAGMTSLLRLEVAQSDFSDLSQLKGMQLTALNLNYTKVKDLSPLRGMPLTSLELCSTPVSDLTPVKGMKLTTLNIDRTQVESIAPLEGMPLTRLYMQRSKVTDLSPLKGSPLKHIMHGSLSEREMAVLKTIPTLEKINAKRAVDFWKEQEKK